MNRPSQRRSPSPSLTSSALILLAISAAVFFIALDGGAFSISSRTVLAVGIWWLVLIGLLLGLWPIGRVARPAVIAAVLLGGFAAWTGASLAWADNREAAFLEFDRVLLYLGLFVLVVLTSRAELLRFWSDGLALGLVSVAVAALLSRFFPDLMTETPGTPSAP